MRYILIIFLFAACSKSSNNNTNPPAAVTEYFVDGLRFVPDTVKPHHTPSLYAWSSNDHYLQVTFKEIPSGPSVDTVSTNQWNVPKNVKFYLQHGSKAYYSTDSRELVTTTFKDGKIYISIPSIKMVGSDTVEVRGTVIHKL